MNEDKDFLSRWSERKRKVAIEEESLEQEAERSDVAVEQSDGLEEAEANRRAAEAVDLKTLDFGSDYSVFFKRGVPKALQAEARRRLWRSSPVLANVDGLNDYDEDFASPNLILKAFKSTYEIGKGYLKKQAEEVAAVPAGGDEAVVQADGGPDDATQPDAPGDQAGVVADQAPLPEEVVARRSVPESAETAEIAEVTPRVSLRDRLGLSSGERET